MKSYKKNDKCSIRNCMLRNGLCLEKNLVYRMTSHKRGNKYNGIIERPLHVQIRVQHSFSKITGNVFPILTPKFWQEKIIVPSVWKKPCSSKKNLINYSKSERDDQHLFLILFFFISYLPYTLSNKFQFSSFCHCMCLFLFLYPL